MDERRLRKMMPPGLAVALYGSAFVKRVADEQKWFLGSYEDLRLALNPQRVAAGYDEISTPGGVRGDALTEAEERYGAEVYAGRSPLLIANSPLLMEAVIRRNYGQEVLQIWRQTLHDRGFPIADAEELAGVFGPSDAGEPGRS